MAGRLLRALGRAAARDAEVAALKAQLRVVQGTCDSLAAAVAQARRSWPPQPAASCDCSFLSALKMRER